MCEVHYGSLADPMGLHSSPDEVIRVEATNPVQTLPPTISQPTFLATDAKGSPRKNRVGGAYPFIVPR